MIKYDLLVYLGLIPLVAVIIFAGFVIWKRLPTQIWKPANSELRTPYWSGFWRCSYLLQSCTSSMVKARVKKFSIKLLQSFLRWWVRSSATFLVPEQNSEPRKVG